MRKITVAEHKGEHKPKGCDHKCNLYVMRAGTAWKLDVYGNHQVVEILEGHAEQAEYTYCLMYFDGRQMAVFKIGEDEYLQPIAENPRATDDRLGSKRKKRKQKAPRRDAPGVAPQAISWENDDEPRSKRDHTPRRSTLSVEPGEVRQRRRKSGPRGGLNLIPA